MNSKSFFLTAIEHSLSSKHCIHDFQDMNLEVGAAEFPT